MLFFCSFLALRAEDAFKPVRSTVDAELHKEREYFAGYGYHLFDSTNAKCCYSRIIDDHFEHALRVFRDEDSGGIRLEASVLKGELKR